MYGSLRKFTMLVEKETSLQFNFKFNYTDTALLKKHKEKLYFKPLQKIFLFFNL